MNFLTLLVGVKIYIICNRIEIKHLCVNPRETISYVYKEILQIMYIDVFFVMYIINKMDN